MYRREKKYPTVNNIALNIKFTLNSKLIIYSYFKNFVKQNTGINIR